jgi:NAD(P)-dependent dehydrogenase (short-subunit alcohol dehydrogenase family)
LAPGGARGIGYAIAQALLEEGAQVMIVNYLPHFAGRAAGQVS